VVVVFVVVCYTTIKLRQAFINWLMPFPLDVVHFLTPYLSLGCNGTLLPPQSKGLATVLCCSKYSLAESSCCTDPIEYSVEYSVTEMLH
jgi:hypothetical protein